jgi:ubiquinone/menaquinone biosynthesis C-methylase UbiE
MIDKKGLLLQPDELQNLILELGCGPRRKYPGSVSIDVHDAESVDLVGDAFQILAALPEGCARLVTSSHFLEHVEDPGAMLDAMSRVLGPDGTIEIIVPHFAHPYFHSDPTHQHRLGFGLYTMSYFAQDRLFRRQVPAYVRREDLEVRSVRLNFKAARPFYGRYFFKRAIGALFDSCRYMRELWEENLCYVFPCYEIRYELGRAQRPG